MNEKGKTGHTTITSIGRKKENSSYGQFKM